MAAKRLSTRCSAIAIAPPIAPSVGSVWLAIQSVYQRLDVRFGSKADMAARLSDVRLTSESGHWLSAFECSLSPKMCDQDIWTASPLAVILAGTTQPPSEILHRPHLHL